MSSTVINSYATYPSAYLVIDPQGIYSKHYYVGTQRIVSRVGDKPLTIFDPVCVNCKADNPEKIDDATIRQVQIQDLQQLLAKAKLGKASFKKFAPVSYDEAQKIMMESPDEEEPQESKALIATVPGVPPIYYYHPDHLGTSTFLTDATGKAYQFFLNLPFGETMAEQKPSSYYASPYKFNGKELDAETGLYYYGARYYDPKSSIWLSVDPLAEKFPGHSPYNYTLNNPINMIDPDGRSPIWIVGSDGKKATYIVNSDGSLKWSKNATADTQRIGNALSKTEKGLEQLNKAQNASHKVSFEIDKVSTPNLFGQTTKKITNINNSKESIIVEAKVVVYEAVFQKFIREVEEGYTFKSEQSQKMTQLAGDLDGLISATAGHEIEHAVGKKNIKDKIENIKKGTNNDVEAEPEKIENEILDQLIKKK